MFTIRSVDSTRAALTAVLDIAEELNDLDARLWANWSLWMLNFYTGDIRAAFPFAERLPGIASSIGEPSALAMLSRALVLQGYLDRAAEQAQKSLQEAIATEYELAICQAPRIAVCPVALMTGDLAAAEQGLIKLVGLANSFNAPFWDSVARCLKGKLLIQRGEFAGGSALLRSELDACERTGWTHWYPEFLGVLAEGLAGLQQFPEALATVEQAIEKAERGGERYYFAELLRVKGEILSAQSNGEQAAAIDVFGAALEVARQQGALLLELRAALSRARHRKRRHRPEDAKQILAPVYSRFVEGFQAADLRAARTLLESLDAPCR